MSKEMCDCERSHNGLGMMGRECDCMPPLTPASKEPPDPAYRQIWQNMNSIQYIVDGVANIADPSPFEKVVLYHNLNGGPLFALPISMFLTGMRYVRDAGWREGVQYSGGP